VLVQGTLPLQITTQIFWVQEHTDPDIRIVLIGLLATIRGAGMLGFGIYGGALADRFNRRRLLLTTQPLAVAMHIGILALIITTNGETAALVPFFLLILGSSALWAIDGPTRQAMVPDIIGQRAAVQGLALNTAGAWALTPIAIIVSGFLIEGVGFTGAYTLLVVFQIAAVLVLIPLRYQRRDSANRPAAAPGLRGIVDGIRYIRGHPTLLSVILLMFLMTAIGMPAVSGLGPTWITTVVGASFSEFGLIGAVWGLSGLAISLALTRYAALERLGIVIVLGTLLFAVGFIIFAADDTALFASLGNAALGAGLVATQIAGTALIAHLAPNAVRARIMSLLLLDRALAQLLSLPVAGVGQAVGLTTVFPILAVTCLLAVSLVIALRPQIWRATTRRGPHPDATTG
jgi:MFS family permease